tara:strand:- start:2086 stop:3216 length:1131 start_codon:yes stop_codon:yes gene_type:complete
MDFPGIKTQIFFGRDSLKKFTFKKKKYGLIISNFIDKEFINHIVSFWRKSGIEIDIIDRPGGEPFSEDIDLTLKNINTNLDGFIGIGGGSVMDFVKALAIVDSNGGSIKDYEFGKRKINKCKPIYLCPSTCGSGSEVTQYVVINNSKTGRKFTIANEKVCATQAAIDPILLSMLKTKNLVEPALDAFTHCLEALLNKNSKNFVDNYSLEGLKLSFRNLNLLNLPKPDYETLKKAALISLYGGISIFHNRTGIIHTLSVAISKYSEASHGLLNAQLLPFALSINEPFYDGKLVELVCNITNINFSTDKEALVFISEWIKNFILYENFPTDLVAENINKIIDRILEDKGLQSVSHGKVVKENLKELIIKMNNEIRQIQ